MRGPRRRVKGFHARFPSGCPPQPDNQALSPDHSGVRAGKAYTSGARRDPRYRADRRPDRRFSSEGLPKCIRFQTRQKVEYKVPAQAEGSTDVYDYSEGAKAGAGSSTVHRRYTICRYRLCGLGTRSQNMRHRRASAGRPMTGISSARLSIRTTRPLMASQRRVAGQQAVVMYVSTISQRREWRGQKLANQRNSLRASASRLALAALRPIWLASTAATPSPAASREARVSRYPVHADDAVAVVDMHERPRKSLHRDHKPEGPSTGEHHGQRLAADRSGYLLNSSEHPPPGGSNLRCQACQRRRRPAQVPAPERNADRTIAAQLPPRWRRAGPSVVSAAATPCRLRNNVVTLGTERLATFIHGVSTGRASCRDWRERIVSPARTPTAGFAQAL